MTTATTTSSSPTRRRAAVAAAAAIAGLGALGLVTLSVGDRPESAGADPTAVSATSSAAPTSTSAPASTTTTLAPADVLAAWYGSLSAEQQLSFRLMSGTDDERSAFAAWISPPPEPQPAPADAAPVPVPLPDPEPVPEPEPAPVPVPEAPAAPDPGAVVEVVGPSPAPVTCASFGSQDEATAWLAEHASVYDMSAIDTDGDGVPCSAAFTPPAPASGPANTFLACVVQRESRGDYGAVNGSSGAGGAYQFLQSTWNNTARNAGRHDLVGVHPSHAAPGDQDAMALHLYQWQGRSPWAGGGC